MAQPIEVLGTIKGMTRDFGIDHLPEGYLYDLVDALPSRKGADVEQRGAWKYLGSHDFGGVIQGGYYSSFVEGEKLLAVGNTKVWDVNISTGVLTDEGTGPATMKQNGVKLHDKVYFFDGAGLLVPRMVTYDGVNIDNIAIDASAPKAKVGIAYRQRLAVGGDPANPQRVSFSPVLDDGGPNSAWDTAEAWIDTTNEVTGMAAMAGQMLIFHSASIERIRGTEPPGLDVDTDMYVETLTDQVGATLAHTIIPWRENIIFADERGVFLTDGSTIRNLVELGGMGDFWRTIYGAKISTGGVACGTFLDYLMVTVICDIEAVNVSFTLICDLNTRSWMRFTNYPATCYIPSESSKEESYCGNIISDALMRTAPMFMDDIPLADPPEDYIDGNAVAVKATLTTGFKKLAKEEGLKRVRNVYLSYHQESLENPSTADGMKVEYRTDPPTPEDVNPATGDTSGWTEAGRVPQVTGYSRKKLPIGKAAYGVMLKVSAVSESRTSRIFNMGVESTAQDRGKVTS